MSLATEMKLGRRVVPPKKIELLPTHSKEIVALKRELQLYSNKKLELKINDNRSTMVSVTWESDCTRVSLHRMFLKAPERVMQALAGYIGRKRGDSGPEVRAFIEESLKKLDYSHQLQPHKLDTQGRVYDLQLLYAQLNQFYFDGQLKLLITWFGQANKRNRSRLTFGLYHDQLKLIKIHRILDAPNIPEYLVKFIIYHEMLHCVSPSYYDANGVHHIHSPEFKALERLYEHYERAQQWITENKVSLFLPQ